MEGIPSINHFTLRRKFTDNVTSLPGGLDPLSKALECVLEHFLIANRKLAKAVRDTTND